MGFIPRGPIRDFRSTGFIPRGAGEEICGAGFIPNSTGFSKKPCGMNPAGHEMNPMAQKNHPMAHTIALQTPKHADPRQMLRFLMWLVGQGSHRGEK